MNTNCEQVLNYYSLGSRGKYTIGNTTLNAISSIVHICCIGVPKKWMSKILNVLCAMIHAKMVFILPFLEQAPISLPNVVHICVEGIE
jgi:hypothetical protein